MKEKQVEQIQDNKLDGTRLRDLNVKGKSSLVLKKIIEDLRNYIRVLKGILEDRRSLVAELREDIKDLKEKLRQAQIVIDRRDRSVSRLPLVKKEAYNKGKEVVTEARRDSAKYYKNKIDRLVRRVEIVQRPLIAKIAKLEGIVVELRQRHKRKDLNLYLNRKSQKELKLKLREMSKEKNRLGRLVRLREKQLEGHRVKNKQLRSKLEYKPKPRKQRVKTVYKQIPMTDQAKLLNRISANQDVDKRFYNLYEVNLKTLKFCNNTSEVKDLNKLYLLLNIFSLETCFKKDIQIPDFMRNMGFLIKQGLVESGTNKINNRYYFVTQRGKEIVTNYKNYISHGASPI